MRRLTATDAAFLHGETKSWHMHVPGLLLLDTTGARTDAEGLRRHVAQRVATVPAFRRRLVQVPLGLDRPSWVESDLDPLDHIDRLTLDDPSSLHAVVARLAEVQLDRCRPLWQFTLIDGLAANRLALFTKTHHSMFDGMAALALGAAIYDLSPAPRTVESTPDDVGSEIPPMAQMLVGAAVRNAVAGPLRMAKTARQLVEQGVAGVIAARTAGVPAQPLTAPNSLYNGKLTAARAFVSHSLDLERLKAIREAAGTTVNDVVLAVVGGALREHLLSRSALTDSSLVAAVPIATTSKDRGGNSMTGGFVALATDVADPLERLRLVHEGAVKTKAVLAALSSYKREGLTAVGPPGLVSLLAWAYDSTGLTHVLRPTGNVTVSSMPGPPVPLWIDGCRIEHIYGIGPLLLSGALNLTCLSYGGHMDIGIASCPDVLVDTSELPSLLDASLEALERAVIASGAGSI